MKRRDLLVRAGPLGALAAMGGYSLNGVATAPPSSTPESAPVVPLTPPTGAIPVAFVISAGAVVIDFAGPWEVFQDVRVPSRGKTMADQMPFRPYTVADSTAAIQASDGMKIVPDYALADAPAPRIIVIPAQNDASPAMLDWIRSASRHADMTMSVCTGAFILARTGLLDGKAASTHHNSYKQFAMQFPQVQLKRGKRFVDEGNVASSGGLSSGIDLALHIVARYFGHDVAAATADQMEYQGNGWLDANSNAKYAAAYASTPGHPRCPICGMEVDPGTAPSSRYHGETYYFCMGAHKKTFDSDPEKWLAD